MRGTGEFEASQGCAVRPCFKKKGRKPGKKLGGKKEGRKEGKSEGGRKEAREDGKKEVRLLSQQLGLADLIT